MMRRRAEVKTAICAIFRVAVAGPPRVRLDRDRSASEDDSPHLKGRRAARHPTRPPRHRSELFLGGEITLEDGWIITLEVSVTWRHSWTGLPRRRFSLDPYAIEVGKRVKGVPATASGLFDALAQTRTSTSARRAGVDRASPAGRRISAPRLEQTGCPEVVCVLFIAFLRRWWAKATASR